MQLVNIPLVLALPSWMRWKEFFFLVYLQVGRFISDNYKFSLDNEPQTLQTAKNLHKNTTKLKNTAVQQETVLLTSSRITGIARNFLMCFDWSTMREDVLFV